MLKQSVKRDCLVGDEKIRLGGTNMIRGGCRGRRPESFSKYGMFGGGKEAVKESVSECE